MNLRHLRYFTILADELHFGRAAQRLHITQSPLSVGIRQLEEELGFRLFERDSKQVALTPAGGAFLTTARELLHHADKATEFGHALARGAAGHLDIGFASAMMFRGLPEILSEFERTHPHVQVALREGSSLEQKHLIRAGRLDASFINVSGGGDVAAEDLACRALYHEHYVACVPQDHRLAGLESVALPALKHERFVMFARERSPGHYDHLMAKCANAGFEPRSRLEVRQFLTVISMVAAGMGVAIVPESIGRAGMPGVRYLPIEGSQPEPTAYLIWDARRSIPGLTTFVETVEQVMARYKDRINEAKKTNGR